MKYYKAISRLILLLLISLPCAANMLKPEYGGKTTVFFSQTDQAGTEAVIKGVVSSFSSREFPDKKDLLGRIQAKSRITVRLYSADGIKEGDVLYIIDRDNLVVSRFTVRFVFNSGSFGPMLVGYGNFRLASEGQRVIAPGLKDTSGYTQVYVARGNYFTETGDNGRAIAEYKKAVELDPDDPAGHLALGMEYRRQGMFRFAFDEFHKAYKSIGRLYNRDDVFNLLLNMGEIRFNEYYNRTLPSDIKNRFRDEAVKYCEEALKYNENSFKVHYMLGVLSYKVSNPDDKKAKDHFLKVIAQKSDHADAHVALSELYYKHRNMGKAREYAQKALVIDAYNQRARELLKYIDSNSSNY